ncbi:unnamed protein product, partial [Lampetra planeri]
SPPSFSKSPLKALLKARSGSEVTLECKPQASPSAISLWKKGNEILQRNERITLLANGTLKITNVTRRDAADYTCVAKESVWDCKHHRETDNHRAYENHHEGQQTWRSIVGESIVLPCQIACDPALDVSFSWAFNGQLIDFQRDGDQFEKVGGPVPEELQNGEGFGYIIAFRPARAVTWTRAAISTVGVSRYVYRNDTIPPFAPFDVKVGAYNNRGEGPFSSIASVVLGRGRYVWLLRGLGAQSVSATQIEVIWEALPTIPERVLGYEIMYWEDDTKPDTVGKVRISGNYTLAKITGLNANMVYYLTVAACNTAGPGLQSAPINITTKKSPPDRAPLNIQWTMIGSTVTLHWDPVVAMETESKVTGYL